MVCNYKVQRLFHYKVRQVLQSVAILLQSATGITKCDDYYKVRQNKLHYTPVPAFSHTNLLERFSIAFTANVRLKFPVCQKLVKFIWFQLIFCLLVIAMEQILKTEK